jgi:fibro-slime domain-containing protein
VFINKKLAVDLGGIHTAVQGVVTISGGNASTVVTNTLPTTAIVNKTSTVSLGLQNGQVYEIVVFQAERQTFASSYQLSLSGFNASKSVCKPVCGGTNPGVSPGEECDNGDAKNCDATASDCYNQCTTECKRGPRCGDGKVQEAHEQCDNGTNTDGYAAAGTNACSPDCTLPPNCGDGKVQMDYGEECDNAADNSDTLYQGCTTKCKLGPSCGDGKVNGDDEHPEACDDGINDGTYNTCSPGCTVAPHCGDGVVQEDWGEQCEPQSSDDPLCTQACKQTGSCGDGVVDAALGEACDYGTDRDTGKSLNDGSYGGCMENCQPAARCGDGLTDAPYEDCDLGEAANTGEYGGCYPNCKQGPHCGDGITNGPEECDEGLNNGLDRCTTICKNYVAQWF